MIDLSAEIPDASAKYSFTMLQAKLASPRIRNASTKFKSTMPRIQNALTEVKYIIPMIQFYIAMKTADTTQNNSQTLNICYYCLINLSISFSNSTLEEQKCL